MADYSPADWMQKMLVDIGTVSHPDTLPLGQWPLYLDGLPDTADAPHEALAIFDTQGRRDGRLMAGSYVRHPGWMIHCRAVDRRDAYQKMETVHGVLSQVHRRLVTIDVTTILVQAISIRSDILSLGELEGTVRRFGFSLNGTISFASD